MGNDCSSHFNAYNVNLCLKYIYRDIQMFYDCCKLDKIQTSNVVYLCTWVVFWFDNNSKLILSTFYGIGWHEIEYMSLSLWFEASLNVFKNPINRF